MATIREISEEAGVSIATVSKVVNGQSGVSKETRELVSSIAKKLNYRPNLSARQLKTGNSRTLGIITEDLTVFNAASIIDGIGVSCDEKNYHYILGNLRFNQRFGNDPYYTQQRSELVADMVEEMLSKQVDGIIYIGCHSHEVTHSVEMKRTSTVCAYCYSTDPDIPSVIYNDRAASYKATQLLIRDGDNKIGVIAGPKDSGHTSSRLLGFQEALFDHGIPYNPHLTYYGNWERDFGFSYAKRLVDQGVTSIFAQNDLMAMGVIDYCNQHGVEVGKDVYLIGFDNREISSVCRPTLSTVSLPLFDIGRTSAHILINTLETGEKSGEHMITLDCNVIERESTGRNSHGGD